MPVNVAISRFSVRRFSGSLVGHSSRRELHRAEFPERRSFVSLFDFGRVTLRFVFSNDSSHDGRNRVSTSGTLLACARPCTRSPSWPINAELTPCGIVSKSSTGLGGGPRRRMQFNRELFRHLLSARGMRCLERAGVDFDAGQIVHFAACSAICATRRAEKNRE